VNREAEKKLATLSGEGVLEPIDLHFGRALCRLCPDDDPWVAVAGALCSHAVQVGHVCLDLHDPLPLVGTDDRVVTLPWPSLERWRELLGQSAAVSDGSRPTPLVLHERGRLYLQRYARYEERLAHCLRSRMQDPLPIDASREAELLEQHFGPAPAGAATDRQREAVRLALRARLAVISGGPGTGKTWTVAKLLLILQQLALEAHGPLQVALLAPTGKAAQRLSESIAQGLTGTSVSEAVLAAIPTEAMTIHRALGYQPRTPTRFTRTAKNPLPKDVVIVDEASMVDLALMTKLAEAVAPNARLVLLGDKDQLASVEAGAIFGDILRAPIEGSTIHLDKSRRYDDDSGIGRLALALRDRSVERARAALDGANGARWVELPARDLSNLEAAVEEGFARYGNATTPEQRLAELGRFRILSAHRAGPRGVVELNAMCERVLERTTRLVPKSGPYVGQPILITSNDYTLELWNGDVGVLGTNPEGTRLVGYFQKDGELRSVPLSRLPRYETVFAMTVHKSQGSEFERVAVVLPEQPSPLLTRELLYTAITRGKREVTLFGSLDVFGQGIANGLRRSSGLADRLG
jgi:exodeoxyribonuclease V alpha subunit